MRNIFNDGQIVQNFDIPQEFRDNTWKKKEWGAQVLRDYVSTFFNKSEFTVEQSRSNNGSLTGTKVVVRKGDVQTTFMLIEPKDRRGEKVHVSKMVENLGEGDFLDVMDYQFGKKGKEAKEPLDNPFAKLAGLKLPK